MITKTFYKLVLSSFHELSDNDKYSLKSFETPEDVSKYFYENYGNRAFSPQIAKFEITILE